MELQELAQQIETKKQGFLNDVGSSKARMDVLKDFESLVIDISQKLVAELKEVEAQEGDKGAKLEDFKNEVIGLADKFKDN